MRYEYKYLVLNHQLDELRRQLHPFIQLDDFAQQQGGEYTVRSIYFDTPAYEHYHSKVNHLPHRLKVRLRGYGIGDDDSTVFFEIKRKYEAPIAKNRCALVFGLAKSLFRPESTDELLGTHPKADNARRFLYQVHSRLMRPVVNIIYEREPFQSRLHDPGNDLRITFDKSLRAVPWPGLDELYSENRVRFATQDAFIVEIKFNHYCPAWVRTILAGLHLRKEPASKYVLGIQALAGEINPFSRHEIFAKGRFFSPLCFQKNTRESMSSPSAPTMSSETLPSPLLAV